MPDDAHDDTADARELLALVAVFELDDVGRFGREAAESFDAGPRLALARRAADAMVRCEEAVARLEALGGRTLDELRRFEGVFDDFDARTVPGGWEEDVLREYLGQAIAEDFCRRCARSLDPESRALVLEVADRRGVDEAAAQGVIDAAAQDPVLAARLSLWGRRIAGEALVLVQDLLTRYASLARLAGDRAEVSRALTERHAQRMEQLGLTP